MTIQIKNDVLCGRYGHTGVADDGFVGDHNDRGFGAVCRDCVDCRLHGFELLADAAFTDHCDRADQMTVHVRVALLPYVLISREEFFEVGKRQFRSRLLTIVKIECERGRLCVNFKIISERTALEMRFNICCNAIITAVALAEFAVFERDLVNAAVGRPTVEFASRYRDLTAAAAVDIERINRVDLAVFDHDVRAAAFTQNTAERAADRGVLDCERLIRSERFDQNGTVPRSHAAAGHHDVVNDAAVCFYINQALVTTGSNVAAVNGHIADCDIRIRQFQTVAVGGRNLKSGLILACALQGCTFRKHCRCRNLMLACEDLDHVAIPCICNRIRNCCIQLVADLCNRLGNRVGRDAVAIRIARLQNAAFRRVDRQRMTVQLNLHLAGCERVCRVRVRKEDDDFAVCCRCRFREGLILRFADLRNKLARLDDVLLSVPYADIAIRAILANVNGVGAAGRNDGVVVSVIQIARYRAALNVNFTAAVCIYRIRSVGFCSDFRTVRNFDRTGAKAQDSRSHVVANRFNSAAGNGHRASSFNLYGCRLRAFRRDRAAFDVRM